MKTKDGPPLFNEGDKGGGKVKKVPLSVILAKAGIQKQSSKDLFLVIKRFSLLK